MANVTGNNKIKSIIIKKILSKKNVLLHIFAVCSSIPSLPIIHIQLRKDYRGGQVLLTTILPLKIFSIVIYFITVYLVYFCSLVYFLVAALHHP